MPKAVKQEIVYTNDLTGEELFTDLQDARDLFWCVYHAD